MNFAGCKVSFDINFDLIFDIACSMVTSNKLAITNPLLIKLSGGIFSIQSVASVGFAKSSSTSSCVISFALSVGIISIKSALYKMR